MLPKITFFTTAVLLSSAQHYEQGNYGHATSSQSAIRHNVAHHHHRYNIQPYHQPIAIHSSPTYPQPIIPIIAHAPVTQFITPVAHVTPLTHHLSPIYVGPAHRLAPISHGPINHNTPPSSQYIRPRHRVSPLTYAGPFFPQGPIIHQAPAIHQIPNYATPAITLQHSNHYNLYQYAHGHQDYYTQPKFEFEYNIQDSHGGDIKSQHEARDGDRMSGFYSLHEPDGSVRTVHYSVAGHSGFNAHMERNGPSTHVQPITHYPQQYILFHQ